MEDSLWLERADDDRLPDERADDDVRYPPQLVEHFLTEYTESGELVLGRAVINVANLQHCGVSTNLAWNVKAAVSQVLAFEREVRVMSDEHPAHITEEYCLVFRR